MPRPPRDERRAQLARAGRQWGQWLRAAMTEDAIDTTTLIERAGRLGATFGRSNVSKWLAGDTTADPANALTIAQALGREPAEALRAASHSALADAVEDPHLARIRAAGMSQADMAVLEQEYRRQIAELDKRIEESRNRARAAAEHTHNEHPRNESGAI